jgi:peptidoglycan/LPS O-acetylase OafA/YrhL
MVAVIVITPVTRLLLGMYYQGKGLPVETVADSVYWNTLSHLDAFFIGGSIPIFSLDMKIRKPATFFISFLLLVFAAGGVSFFNAKSPLPYYQDLGLGMGRMGNYEHVWHYTLLNLLFASFILLMVSSNTRNSFRKLKSILEMKWLVRIGKVSYGMYVFHWAILVYIFKHIYTGQNLMHSLPRHYLRFC